MSYLLRQARRAAWSGEEHVENERRAHARASFGRREEDSDGVSIFASSEESHPTLVVAAIACGKRETGKMDLLRVEEEEIALFGQVTPILGVTPVKPANRLHRVLDWNDEQLSGLVDCLLARKRRSTRYPDAEVRNAVLSLNPLDVDEGPWRDWVVKLHGTPNR
jgi:hypothetical protein